MHRGPRPETRERELSLPKTERSTVPGRRAEEKKFLSVFQDRLWLMVSLRQPNNYYYLTAGSTFTC